MSQEDDDKVGGDDRMACPRNRPRGHRAEPMEVSAQLLVPRMSCKSESNPTAQIAPPLHQDG